MREVDLISRIARLIVDDNAILLVGDRLRQMEKGASLLARLSDALAERIDYQRDDRSLPSVARDFEVLRGRTELIQAIQSEIEEAQFESDPFQQLIADAVMPHTKIITTRFDKSIENALRIFDKRYVLIVRDADIPAFDESLVTLIKIHGDITQPDSLVLTEDDMDAFIDNLPTISDVIRAFFATKTLVFLGYDLNDEIFKRSFRQVARNVSAFQRPAYAIVSSPLDEVETKYWERQNLHVLVEEPGAFLDELAGSVKSMVQEAGEQVERPAFQVEQPPLPPYPYKALESFTEADAAIFAGRTEESQRLANRILANRLTVLYGESGSGKTSLLRAGAGPRMAMQRAMLSVCTPTPGRSLEDELTTSLFETGERLGLSLPEAGGTLERIRTLAAEMDGPVVIAIDQFEQFFLLNETPEINAQAGYLGGLVSNRTLDLRLVLVIREDFIGRMQILEGLIPGLLDTRFRLQVLGREAARAAIEEPAKAYGVRWEEALVQRLLDDLYEPTGGGIAPPQLQIVCDQLYRQALEAAAGDRSVRISADLFKSLGGTQSILGDYLERTIGEFSTDQQLVVRRLLGALVGSSRVKQRLTLDALARAAEVEALIAGTILDQLTRLRLTRRYESSQGSELSYELTHDYLAERIALWLGEEFWKDQKVREILRVSLPEFRARARLLAPDDLRLVAEQRERVRYSEDELALIYASAVTYDDLPVSWEGSFSETTRRDILMGLASHPIAPARLGAAKQLGSYGDPEVMAALADLAVADQEPGVREAAAKSLATGGHCACVERILEIDPDPQPGDAARQALVWIRDLNPDCGASMPTDLERSIKRQVWGRRWRHYKGQVQATTLRGALGGLVGIGLGVGLFLGLISVATSSVEIEQVLAQWKLVVSLVTMGIPLAGMVGAVAAGSSAFVTALLGSLGDRAQDWRNWIFGTLTGAILMGLGFMLLGAIFAGEARLLQLFAAGALVGGLLIGVSAAPMSAPRWLIGILAVIAGVLAFILSGQLGWFDSPVAWWLVFMGSVAGIGFYLGLRPGREVS